MKIAVFSAKSYDKEFLSSAAKNHDFKLVFFEPRLKVETALLAKGFDAVCVFVHDVADAAVLKILRENGVRLIALRCAGFNNVDVKTAMELGITVVRVPAYSPHGVAEHAAALMLGLNRKIYRSFNRVREGNFSLEGLLGFDMSGKTVGIVGTGKIGSILARIMHGFGMEILAYDAFQNPECLKSGAKYVSLDELLSRSDIISLHLPLMPETHHMINDTSVAKMKKGVMLINTSRGALVDTKAVIKGLKSGRIGYLGLDVYEEEGDLFFEDLSGEVLQDDTFARLLTFPNVIITGHQAFFTQTALANISETTIGNIKAFMDGNIAEKNLVSVSLVRDK